MNKPDILSKADIENLAESFLLQYGSTYLKKAQKVDLEYILESKLGLTLDYQIMDKNNNILGLTAFNDSTLEVFLEDDSKRIINVNRGTIVINTRLAEEEKMQKCFQYTLGHETGHWILHRKNFSEFDGQMDFFDAMNDNKSNLVCAKRDERYILKRTFKTDLDWIEWQADYFSSCVIMPKNIFLNKYEELKRLGLSDIECVNKLSDIFEVSKIACKIRLKNLLSKNIEELDNIKFFN